MLSEIPGLAAAAAILIQAACFYLTLLFMSSSRHKASDFEAFVESINNHDILPIALSRSIAWAFLVLEIAVVTGLLINNEIRHYSLMLAVALLLVYTSSLSVNLVRGRSDYALVRQVGILYERVAPAGALMIGGKYKVGDYVPPVHLNVLSGRQISIGG